MDGEPDEARSADPLAVALLVFFVMVILVVAALLLLPLLVR